MKTFSIARGRYVINDQAALDAGAPAVQPAGGATIDVNTIESARVKMEQDLAGLAARAASPAPAPAPSFTKQKTRVTRKPQVTAPPADASKEPAAEPLAPPAPKALTVGSGDTLLFDVDDDDYAICVLRVLHADGSEDWVEFTRNGGELDAGHDSAPPAPGPAAPEAPAKTASW
jgi:hypothetical protein